MPSSAWPSRFNYAEMAGLILARSRSWSNAGTEDEVAADEWVGYEFAKVKRLYDALGIGDRTGLALFNAGHQIDARRPSPSSPGTSTGPGAPPEAAPGGALARLDGRRGESLKSASVTETFIG